VTRQVTIEELWNAIDHLAQEHPDAHGDLHTAALATAGADLLTRTGVRIRLAQVTGEREPGPWGRWLIKRSARMLGPGAGHLLAYISAYTDAGRPWGEVPQLAGDFELAVIPAIHDAAVRRALDWP
jgi:hypothetical protein